MTAMTQNALVRRNNFVEKLVISKLFWVIAVSFLFAYPVIKSVRRQLPNALPIYHAVPEFSFTDENGKAFGTSELKGKVYLAHFMSSDCAGECALSFQQLQQIQHRIRGVIDRAAIVSFTINPKNDTSDVLFKKARELNANPIVWRFVTGPESEVKSLVIDGFKVPGDGEQVVETLDEAVRSHRLALIDQQGNVRGFYILEKNEINKLMIDLGLLINRKKS